MKLYHGSNIVIEHINLAMCRPFKDFGKGFYLTDIKEQAEKMAKRVSKIYGGDPVVNAFMTSLLGPSQMIIWHYYFVNTKMRL